MKNKIKMERGLNLHRFPFSLPFELSYPKNLEAELISSRRNQSNQENWNKWRPEANKG